MSASPCVPERQAQAHTGTRQRAHLAGHEQERARDAGGQVIHAALEDHVLKADRGMRAANTRQCLGQLGIGGDVSTRPHAPAVADHSDFDCASRMQRGEGIRHLGPKHLRERVNATFSAAALFHLGRELPQPRAKSRKIIAGLLVRRHAVAVGAVATRVHWREQPRHDLFLGGGVRGVE